MIASYTIPFRLPSLNEYINACRRNKFAGSTMKKQLEADIILSAFSKAKKLEGKVWIEFTWHEKTKRRDKDNVCGLGQKLTLDSMQKKGILENDNNQCIEGLIHKFVYGKEDKVEVRVFADRRK